MTDKILGQRADILLSARKASRMEERETKATALVQAEASAPASKSTSRASELPIRAAATSECIASPVVDKSSGIGHPPAQKGVIL